MLSKIISKSEQLSRGDASRKWWSLDSGPGLPTSIAHISLTHWQHIPVRGMSFLPSVGGELCQSSRTLFGHLTSPSSLYPACLVSSSPPEFRHTQDFPTVKPINKPAPPSSFPTTVFIHICHLYFLTTVLMKPLVPKPRPTFWLLSLKHTSQFSFYLTAGGYLMIANAPSILKVLSSWLVLLSSQIFLLWGILSGL